MEASANFQPTDEALCNRVAAGDRRAFDELYRRYAGPLAAYAGRMLRDRSQAEDIAQTALMNAFNALDGGARPRSPRPWLYRITHNAALATLRGANDVPREVIEREQPDELESRAIRDTLLAGLEALPERQRWVYLLRELRGLDVSEIATTLDLRPEQVEQALFAAKNKLAERLSFGQPVTCGLVQSRTSSSIGRGERRALKAHLRGCPGCRAAGVTEGTLGWYGGGILGTLQRLAATLSAGGAPVVAKVGAVTATALLGLAAGNPGLAHRFFLSSARAEPMRPGTQTVPRSALLTWADIMPGFVQTSAQAGVAASAPGSSQAAAPPASASARGVGPAGTVATAASSTPTDQTTTDTQEPTTDEPTTDTQDPTTDETTTDEPTPDEATTGEAQDAPTDPSPDPPTDPAADPGASDPGTVDPTASDSVPPVDPTPTDPVPSTVPTL